MLLLVWGPLYYSIGGQVCPPPPCHCLSHIQEHKLTLVTILCFKKVANMMVVAEEVYIPMGIMWSYKVAPIDELMWVVHGTYRIDN